jgi:ketosteroid isomerase-like protein
MRPAITILAVLAIALAAAGCGGGKPDKEQIESTITSYYRAFGSGDGAGACKQLTKGAIELLEKSAGGRKCADVLDEALKRPDYARIAPKLKNARVAEVKVSGDNATARAEVPGAGRNGAPAKATVPLKKEGGSWKIVSTASGG